MCPTCTLPGYDGAQVFLSEDCTPATPANTWRAVPQRQAEGYLWAQLVNLATGGCLTAVAGADGLG